LWVLAVLAAPGWGQQWAQKMFSTATHDFGTVARGAKAEFVFPLQNIYQEDIHIASVRASCGCAQPSIVKDSLKTWEKGGILVRFNTRSFTGQRAATITVTIDRPYYAEVQLQITGYIRGDVVFDPGVVQFNRVAQGETAEQILRISYAGRDSWQIEDVLSANTNLEVIKSQARRSGGRVDYELVVRLNGSADAGYFADEMILVTNDSRLRRIPVKVEGNVVPALTVSPASLYLGDLQPGESVTKNLVIRAKEPFRVQEIRCDSEAFEFKPTDEAKALHVVPVTFTAGATTGKISQTIEIVTDIGNGQVATCLATATIRDGSRTVAAQTQEAL
jgi:hypothetical protein